MRSEDFPEDIDGNQDNNPYNSNLSGNPFISRASAPFSFFWQEREYWRHWKCVKCETGHWPFWSAMVHLVIMVLLPINVILFFSRREWDDWSGGTSWLIGVVFGVSWLAFFGVGREVIRGYETKLYAKRGEEKKHWIKRS